MTPNDIAKRIQDQLGSAITEVVADDKHPRVHTTAENWRKVAEFIFNDSDLAFDWLGCLSGVDYVADNQLCGVYDLYSTKHGHWFAVKVYVDRDKPNIPSVMDLWPAADWHEREAFDMYGIIFDGHTDLRRILCPEDWVGYPLRKDYQFPREYHGIPGTTELDWQQQSVYPA
jgi:NADH-quinone oxidoreductase subunit C